MRKSILITGVLGQDGSLLAEHLAGLGHDVVGIVRSELDVARSNVDPRIRLLHVDIADEAGLRALIGEIQPAHIYHLAAFHHSSQEATGKATIDADREILRVNFLSTRAIAFAAVECAPAARLVFAGSSQMYTAHRARLEIDETTPREPATLYGHAKAWSMDMLAFLRSQRHLHASTAILFNHESPRRGAQFVTRKITRTAAAARRGECAQLELMNLGAAVDWTSARDVVRALHLMAEAPSAGDYVVASGRLRTVRDVLDVAFGHLGLDWRPYVAFREDSPVNALVGKPGKAERMLGWRREVSFERMITEMVDHDVAEPAV